MAQGRADIINELKENESFRYIVDTLHLFFNIPQPSSSTDIEDKILMLQNKYEEIASDNQQTTIEEILTELVALKEKMENQDQNQQQKKDDIASIKEALEKIQQENTATLKDEIEKLQNEHKSWREENENRVTSMKEEIQKLQNEHKSWREENEILIASMKEEIEKLQQENTSLREQIEKFRQETEAALFDDEKDTEDGTFSIEDNEVFHTMKEDIKRLSKEAHKLKKEFIELKGNKESQEDLIDTLQQEKQVQLEHMKQHTDLLTKLSKTDQHQQSQLDDLRNMLDDQSSPPQYSSQEPETQSVKTPEETRSQERGKEAIPPPTRGSTIGDLRYHLLEYSVEDGNVIWKGEDVAVQSNESWPEQPQSQGGSLDD